MSAATTPIPVILPPNAIIPLAEVPTALEFFMAEALDIGEVGKIKVRDLGGGRYQIRLPDHHDSLVGISRVHDHLRDVGLVISNDQYIHVPASAGLAEDVDPAGRTSRENDYKNNHIYINVMKPLQEVGVVASKIWREIKNKPSSHDPVSDADGLEQLGAELEEAFSSTVENYPAVLEIAANAKLRLKSGQGVYYTIDLARVPKDEILAKITEARRALLVEMQRPYGYSRALSNVQAERAERDQFLKEQAGLDVTARWLQQLAGHTDVQDEIEIVRSVTQRLSSVLRNDEEPLAGAVVSAKYGIYDGFGERTLDQKITLTNRLSQYDVMKKPGDHLQRTFAVTITSDVARRLYLQGIELVCAEASAAPVKQITSGVEFDAWLDHLSPNENKKVKGLIERFIW